MASWAQTDQVITALSGGFLMADRNCWSQLLVATRGQKKISPEGDVSGS